MAKRKMGVLVTTDAKGVFFGYLIGKPSKEKVTIERARNCIYWDAKTKGFGGLAETGPSSGCRVGPAMPRITLFGITSVSECTPKATAAWEKQPWG